MRSLGVILSVYVIGMRGPFWHLNGFRRIFSRFEKLDVVFLAFLSYALIVEALRVV